MIPKATILLLTAMAGLLAGMFLQGRVLTRPCPGVAAATCPDCVCPAAKPCPPCPDAIDFSKLDFKKSRGNTLTFNLNYIIRNDTLKLPRK